MNQVKKMLRALMTFSEMNRSWWVFLFVWGFCLCGVFCVYFCCCCFFKSITSQSIREVLDAISESIIPGPVFWST